MAGKQARRPARVRGDSGGVDGGARGALAGTAVVAVAGRRPRAAGPLGRWAAGGARALPSELAEQLFFLGGGKTFVAGDRTAARKVPGERVADRVDHRPAR